jgi:hypothetical protein
MKNSLQDQILVPFAHLSCLLPDDSAGRIARELWWTNQESSSVYINSTKVIHSYISHGDEH